MVRSWPPSGKAPRLPSVPRPARLVLIVAILELKQFSGEAGENFRLRGLWWELLARLL